MDKILNWTKSQTEQNPEWTKSRNGQNPEWTKCRMDKIPNGRIAEWAKSRNSRNTTRETQKMLKLPDPAGGAHSAPPNPLAGFTQILCLVVFFIGPNYMRISFSSLF